MIVSPTLRQIRRVERSKREPLRVGGPWGGWADTLRWSAYNSDPNDWSDVGVPVAAYSYDGATKSAGTLTAFPNDINPGTYDMAAVNAAAQDSDGWDGEHGKATFDGTNDHYTESTAYGGQFNGEDAPWHVVAAVETGAATNFLTSMGNTAGTQPYMTAISYHGTSLRAERQGGTGTPVVVSGSTLFPRTRHIVVMQYHGASGGNRLDLWLMLPGDDAPRLAATGTVDVSSATFNVASIGALVRSTVSLYFAGSVREIVIFSSLFDRNGACALMRKRARLNGQLGGEGMSFGPIATSAASADVGSFTLSDRFEGTANGIDLQPGNCAALLFRTGALPASLACPWSYTSAALGWYLTLTSAGVLQFRSAGVGGAFTIGNLPANALCCLVIWRTAGGALRASLNGRAAAQVAASPTINAVDGTSVHVIGGVNAAVNSSGYPFADGAAVLEVAGITTEPSDAEAQEWSAQVVAIDRYQLPDAVRSHSDLVFCLAATDWDGSTGTWTSVRGSSPVAMTKVGSPVKTTIAAENIYQENEAWWQGIYNYKKQTVGSLGEAVFRRDGYAMVEIATSATQIDVEVVPEMSATSQMPWTSIAVYDGDSFQSKQSIANYANIRHVHRFELTSGDKAVRLWEALRTTSPQVGTFIRRLRAPASTPLSIVPTKAPTSRCLFDGDSILNGHGASDCALKSFVGLLKKDFPNSVAVTGYGSGSWFTAGGSAIARRDRIDQIRTTLRNVPDAIYYFQFSTNDYGLNHQSAADFQSALEVYLDELHAEFPACKVVLQTATLRTTETANSFGDTLGDYRTAMATVQAARATWITLIDGTALTELANMQDGLHPNDTGHSDIYAAIKPTLVSLGLS